MEERSTRGCGSKKKRRKKSETKRRVKLKQTTKQWVPRDQRRRTQHQPRARQQRLQMLQLRRQREGGRTKIGPNSPLISNSSRLESPSVRSKPRCRAKAVPRPKWILSSGCCQIFLFFRIFFLTSINKIQSPGRPVLKIKQAKRSKKGKHDKKKEGEKRGKISPKERTEEQSFVSLSFFCCLCLSLCLFKCGGVVSGTRTPSNSQRI